MVLTMRLITVVATVLALATQIDAQASAQAQVVAGLQQLSKSPQYAPTILLITSNQPLYQLIINSPLIAAAIGDPTGTQYFLAIFGSPIYKEVLSNPQTAKLLAASPALASVLASPASEAPIKLGLLLTTAQLPAAGNALIDYQTLEASLKAISGLAPAPGPARATAPAPSPSVSLRGLPVAGK